MMKGFQEALTQDSYPGGWAVTHDGRAVLTIAGHDGTYTVEFEPLLFGQYYVAIYRDSELIANKVPVRPGGPEAQVPG